MTKKRINWIDMAKGYGILLVIIGHLTGGALHDWIYTFHMPLFFLLSGYVFSDRQDFKSFLIKKCRSILIPYACLGVPILIVKGMQDAWKGIFEVRTYAKMVVNFFLQHNTFAFWFFACLFFLNIIFYLTKKWLKTDNNLALFTALFTFAGLLYYKAGGPSLPWKIDTCMTAYPFFFVGYYYKEHYESVDNYFSARKHSILAFIILGAVWIVSGYFEKKISGITLEMYYNQYGFAPLTYISAFSGIFCTVIFSKWMTIRPVRYIGEYSCLYYAWHDTLMIPLSELLLSLLSPTIWGSGFAGSCIYKIAELLLIVCFLSICNYIIAGNRLRFMIGKSYTERDKA